jgi:hypothetical protein
MNKPMALEHADEAQRAHFQTQARDKLQTAGRSAETMCLPQLALLYVLALSKADQAASKAAKSKPG